VAENFALRMALENGHLSVVQYLISIKSQFPKIDPCVHDNVPILLTAQNGHLSIVKYLISIPEY